MMKSFATIATAVLSIAACLHFLHLLMDWEVSIAGVFVPPMWASYLGLLLAGDMAFMLWHESRQGKV